MNISKTKMQYKNGENKIQIANVAKEKTQI